MARFVYNSIELWPSQLLEYSHEPIWDGPTYLYTRHRIHVRGVYNPATTSAFLDGPFFVLPSPTGDNTQFRVIQPYSGAKPVKLAPFPNFVAPYDFGRLNLPVAPACYTETTLRHFLVSPRRPLVYMNTVPLPVSGEPVGGVWNINYGVLVSPQLVQKSPNANDLVFYDCDDNIGPTCVNLKITENKGDKTYIVEAIYQTDINECNLFATSESLSALLSHRWYMEEELDEDFFATRTIRGRAIFRTSRLRFLGLVPDDYRTWLMHPVLPLFKRDRVHTRISEDGTMLDYVISDSEQATTYANVFVKAGITRIEAFQNYGVTRMSEFDRLVEVGRAATDAGQSIVADAASNKRGVAKGRITKNFGRGMLAAKAAIGIGHVVLSYINTKPRTFNNLTVRVWGNNLAIRKSLKLAAFMILMGRLPKGEFGSATSIVQVTEDLTDKFVEVRADLNYPPVLQDLTIIPNISNDGKTLHGIPFPIDTGPDSTILTDANNVDVPLLLSYADNRRTIANPLPYNQMPPPPFDSVGRGVSTQILFANYLQGQCCLTFEVVDGKIKLNPGWQSWQRGPSVDGSDRLPIGGQFSGAEYIAPGSISGAHNYSDGAAVD